MYALAPVRAQAETGTTLSWRWLSLPRVWMRRARERRELCGLDRRQLDDAGIDPDYVWAEARKPFWRA